MGFNSGFKGLNAAVVWKFLYNNPTSKYNYYSFLLDMWALRSKFQEDKSRNTHTRIQALSNVGPIQIVFCYDSYDHDFFSQQSNFWPCFEPHNSKSHIYNLFLLRPIFLSPVMQTLSKLAPSFAHSKWKICFHSLSHLCVKRPPNSNLLDLITFKC